MRRQEVFFCFSLLLVFVLIVVTGCTIGGDSSSDESSRYGNSSSIPDEEVGKEVRENLEKMEQICIDAGEDFDAAGWGSMEQRRRLTELGKAAVPQTLEFVKDKNKNKFARMLLIHEVLSEIKDERVVSGLIDILEDSSEDPDIRDESALALGMQEEKKKNKAKESVINTLISALYTPYPQIRATAALSLGRIGDNRAVEHLINLVKNDENVDVRQMAAGALGSIGDPFAIDTLIETMNKEDEAGIVKIAAMGSLTQFKEDKAIEALIDKYRARADVCVVDIFGYVEDPRVVDLLIEALGNDNVDIRWSAVDSLFKIASKGIEEEKIVEALKNTLKEEQSISVRKAIGMYLKELTGEEYPY